MPAGKHIFTSFKNIIFIFLVIFVLSACSKGNDKVISSENTIIERENHDSIENVISSEIVRVYSENHNSAGLKEKQIQTALQNLANKQFALWNSYKEVAPSILIDGDKKAEYFPPTYPDKPDNIRVTVGTKTYDFPGVYSEEAKKKYISAIDRCLVDKAFLNDDKEHQITYN